MPVCWTGSHKPGNRFAQKGAEVRVLTARSTAALRPVKSPISALARARSSHPSSCFFWQLLASACRSPRSA